LALWQRSVRSKNPVAALTMSRALPLLTARGVRAQMNTLAALQMVAERVGTPGAALLQAYRPSEYAERVSGRSLAAAGCEPILHMRAFQRTRRLPDALVQDVLARVAR